MRQPGRQTTLNRLVWVIAVFLLLCCRPCQAVSEDMGGDEYLHRAWQSEDGLPQNSVQCIAQTRDGYLWVGTQDGLARFNGVEFKTFNARNTRALKASAAVMSLLAEADGTLWIGTEGAGLVRHRDGQFSNFTIGGPFTNAIRAIVKDGPESFWLGTSAGVARFINGKVTHYVLDGGFLHNSIKAMLPAPGGTFWLATGGGLVHFTPPGVAGAKDPQFKRYTAQDGLSDNSLRSLYLDNAGVLWIGGTAGLTRYKDGKFSVFTDKDGLPDIIIRCIFQDRDGHLWFGTTEGLSRWANGTFEIVKGADFQDIILGMFEDQEGNLWVGTNDGLKRLKASRFKAFSKEQGLSFNLVVTAFEDREKNLWVGTWGGGLNKLSGGRFSTLRKSNGLSSDYILALCEDHSGNLWVGTDNAGLNQVKDGKITSYSLGLSDMTIRAICEDKQGRLWIGTTMGLNRFENGSFVPAGRTGRGKNNIIRVLCPSRKGDLWIGTEDGLIRMTGDKFTTYTTSDGLSHNTIFSLYEDNEGVLWIGTDGGGLNRLRDGRFSRFTPKDGLFNDAICSILEDTKGNLWMSCRLGIFHVSKKQLNDFAAGRASSLDCVSFEREDGMIRSEVNGVAQPASWVDHRGNMWFATSKGLVLAAPGKIKRNDIKPTVKIESVLFADEPIQLTHDMRLPRGAERLEFHYAALSLAAPTKVFYKYRLEGYEHGWVNAGTRRVAYYNNLRPGNYTFRVIACNNDGVWNETGDSVSFSLVPRYYETYWFYSLCGLAVIGSIASLFRFRVQNMKRREQELIAHSRELQREILERQEAQTQTAAFSSLGHDLSAATSAEAAARLIAKVADDLLGWDACVFLVFFEERNEVQCVLHVDSIDGKRQDLSLDLMDRSPTPMMLRVLKEGPQLLMRDPEAPAETTELLPFGNPERRSASLMFVPVRNGKKTIGMLTIQSYTANAYTQADLKTLEALASHCGGALERIAVQNRVQQQLRREAAFATLGYDLSGATSPEDAARIICNTAQALLGWDAASLRLYSAAANQVVPVLNIDTVNGKKVDVPNNAWSSTPMDDKVMKEGGKLLLRNPNQPEEVDLRLFGDKNRRSASLMFVPLRNGGKCIGILSIQSYRSNAYTASDLNTLQTLADHCGGAVERIAAQEGLREAHGQLEMRVEQRTAELSNANQLLKTQIAERQRAEEALFKSESQLRMIWENSLDGMRLLDEEGNFLLVNSAYCRLVGKPREFLIGKQLAVIYESSRREEVMRKHRENFRGRSFPTLAEREVILWNGKKLFLEYSNCILEVQGEPPRLLSTFRDITDRKRLEEQARQSQKMESIGQLAAGVAHDFNNLLTIIHGHTSLLMVPEGKAEQDSVQSLREISEATERAANLTRQLLAFSRKQVMQPKPIDLNDVIGNVAKMLRRLLGEHVELKLTCASDLPQIHADTGMIEQIIINMAVNARDAMHTKGGQLKISTNALAITAADLIRSAEARMGRFVCLTIADTGCGMDPATLKRIFEPFFTTKEVGKGTGLGLATVYGIVKQHHGWLEVDSQVGKGSTFKVFFPAHEIVVARTPDTTHQPRVEGGKETILVVEDEQALRDLTQQVLRHYGYNVLAAESGVDALDIWAAQHERIDLLLTDMMMPKGISGRDLSERLRIQKPKLKVLYTSGYSEELLGDSSVRNDVNFLPKPYLPITLAQAVRDCLDNRRRERHHPEVLM